MLLMPYFRTESEALHLAVSSDGLNWKALNGNNPVLEGTLPGGSMRDPFLLRSEDGLFHLLATNGWNSSGILHTQSADLIHWQEQTVLPVMAEVPGVRNCWAPEGFYDPEKGIYRILWSSSVAQSAANEDWDHRIWGAATKDFHTCSPSRLFFDPGYSVIDATVVRFSGRWLMAFKDERGQNRPGTDFKAIRVAWSPQAEGPYAEISALLSPPPTEGPVLFRREEMLTMLFDHFLEGYFGGLQSADGHTWGSLPALPALPDGLRHASVLEVEDSVAAALKAYYKA